MSYSRYGRVVLVIIVISCAEFLRTPRKHFFVYPRRVREGKLFYVRSTVRVVAVMLLILFAFDLRRPDKTVPNSWSNRYVMFLLDGSLSMSADDVQPSRFKAANQLIGELVNQTKNTYWLIVFSWLPVIRIPWSSDSKGIAAVVSSMQLGDFPATNSFLGTALGDALLLALRQFQNVPQTSDRILVIISDGDSNKGYDPYKLIEMLRQQQIRVYFIALGEEGYQVGVDQTGLPVITSFDNALMEQFSAGTEGALYRNPTVLERNELRDILDTPIQETTTQFIVSEWKLNKKLLPWLVVCMIALFLFVWRDVVLIRRKK